MRPLETGEQVASDEQMLSLAFSLTSEPGSYAVLLGAGISVSSKMPSAWSVLQDLLSKLAMGKNAAPETDDERISWYRDEYGEEPTYERVLEHVAPSSRDRQAILRGYFEVTPEEQEQEPGIKQPTAAHRAIARLVAEGAIKVIVTLNFDNLTEAALRDRGVIPLIIRGQKDLEGLGPLHTARAVVVHLHGDYLAPNEMRNTESELNSYTPTAEAFLDRIMKEYGLVLVGWSATYDRQLRSALKRSFRRIYVPYWVEPRTFTDEANEVAEHLAAVKVRATADQALGALHDSYIALRDRAAVRHPLTPATVVATAKRELAGRFTAIRLHDLIKRESDRLHQHPDLLLSYTGAVSEDRAFAGMVDRLEEASSALMSAVGAAAYWGDETTDQWWMNEIQAFAVAPRSGGLSAVLNLHNLVMMRLFFAAGIAAVAAGRYDTLQTLFALEGDRTGSGRDFAVRVLEPARIYDPLPSGSKRLYEQLKPLFVDHLLIGEKTYEERWQLFEILRNLAAAAADPTGAARLANLTASRPSFEEANRAYEQWCSQQQNPPAALAFENWEPAAQAKDRFERDLQLYADLVPFVVPHLKAVLTDENTYESPVVQKLSREISGAGRAHPLLSSEVLTGTPESVMESLRAANNALQRIIHYGRQRTHSGASEAYLLPDDLWVDEA